MSSQNSAIWIGLFDVTGPKENPMLDGNLGAWLWVAAQANSADHLVLRMQGAMEKLGLGVHDYENISEVIDENELGDSQRDLLPEAKSNQESVVCGTWHTYKNVDA